MKIFLLLILLNSIANIDIITTDDEAVFITTDDEAVFEPFDYIKDFSTIPPGKPAHKTCLKMLDHIKRRSSAHLLWNFNCYVVDFLFP